MALHSQLYLALQFFGILFIVEPAVHLLFRLPTWAYFAFPSLILALLLWVRHYELDRRKLRLQADIERARAEEQERQSEKLEAALHELKQKNQEIVAAQQKLVSLDQFATLGQLMAGIAHEIKTPLNFVNNFSDISTELVEELSDILEKYKSQIQADDYQAARELMSDLKKNNTDILDNGRRANSIIKSVMDHARGTEAQVSAVSLNELLEENVKMAYHGYRATDPTFNIDIHRDYHKGLPKVPVIPSDLGRVLLNILNNACYATQQKQRAAGSTYQPQLWIGTRLLTDKAEITIRDNGPGIPQEVISKIFLPFYTTKPSGEGNTGLGLSISREIIEEKHHGRISVASEVGAYTEFTIQLPIA
jgi:signal transduction histidine kinase